jgi:hypothetical protein
MASHGHQNSTPANPASHAARARSASGSSAKRIEQFTSNRSPYVRTPQPFHGDQPINSVATSTLPRPLTRTAPGMPWAPLLRHDFTW